MNTYTEILAAFNDVTRDSARHHFSAGTVDNFANRALRAICERTKYLSKSDAVNVTSAVAETQDPGYDIFRVDYENEVLLPITRDQLRYADRDWASRTGTPKYYYLDELYRADQQYLRANLFEAPSSGGARIWYHAYPTEVDNASPSGEIEIPDWAVGAVLYYMLYLAYRSETQIRNENTSAFYKMLYDHVLDRLQARVYSENPKRWICGEPARPSVGVTNRLPQRITP